MDLDTPTNDGAAGGSRPNQHQHLPAAIGGVDPRTNIDHSPLIDEARLEDDLRQRSGGHRSSNFDVSNGEGFTQNENFAKPDVTNLDEPTWRHPIRSTRKFFKELNGHFGKRFLIWLGVVQCAVSGGVFALVMALGLPLFKELGIDASRQQLYMSLIMSPWAMKPFIGVASDLFPIGGYNKKYFALYSIFVGLFGCAVLLSLFQGGAADAAVAKGQSAVNVLTDYTVICFTFISYEAATLDILGEGKYSEMMRRYPESGSSIISFKFGFSLLGSVVVQTFVGPLADAKYFEVLFWIALVLSLTPLYPTWRNYLPETKRMPDEPGMRRVCGGRMLFDNGSFQHKRAPFIVITLCGLSAPILAAVTTYADLAIGLIVSALLLVAFAVATFVIFPLVFFRVFMAIIITCMSWISIGSALSYWYTASEQCNPGGPHFSYTYYITVTGIIGSVVNFVAVLLYQNFLSGWRFRPVLIFTLVIGCAASIIDLTIIMRWNIAIGIPDKVYFLFGNAIIENLVIVLNSIPMSAIYAKIAPPGMESAVFAFTVGIANFCNMVSQLLGSGVISWSGMTTVGDDCNWEQLPYLIVIFQILIPLLVGVPAVFLIPNVLQTEHLIDWDKEASSWRQRNADGPDEDGTRTPSTVDDDVDSRLEPLLL